jgi:hypothetical protein
MSLYWGLSIFSPMTRVVGYSGISRSSPISRLLPLPCRVLPFASSIPVGLDVIDLVPAAVLPPIRGFDLRADKLGRPNSSSSSISSSSCVPMSSSSPSACPPVLLDLRVEDCGRLLRVGLVFGDARIVNGDGVDTLGAGVVEREALRDLASSTFCAMLAPRMRTGYPSSACPHGSMMRQRQGMTLPNFAAHYSYHCDLAAASSSKNFLFCHQIHENVSFYAG